MVVDRRGRGAGQSLVEDEHGDERKQQLRTHPTTGGTVLEKHAVGD